MSYDIRGAFAAAALCATLAACGGGGGDSTPPAPPPPPPPVPATVTIQADTRADTGASEQFATSVTATTGLSFHWDFGDGSSAETPTAAHAYAAPGDYQVVVAVSNAAQDVRTATWTMHVGHYANVAGDNCTGGSDGSGWCWQNVLGSDQTINDVWFLDATHGWAVGTNATVLKTADGGKTWAKVAVDPAMAGITLYGVRFADANTGLITGGGSQYGSGTGGMVLHTSDGGTTWKASTIGVASPPGAQSHVEAWDGSTVIVGDGYNHATSHDNGATWATSDYTASQVTENGGDCWTLDSTQIAARAGCGTAVTSSTLLMSLPPTVNAYFVTPAAIAFTSSTQGIALANYTTSGGSGTAVMTTTDRGATWSAAEASGLPSYVNPGTLRMSDASHGWIAIPVYYYGSTSPFYATADGGLTWTPVPLPASFTPSYYFYPGYVTGNAYWVANGSSIAVTGDFGATWQTGTISAEPACCGSAALARWIDTNDFVVSINSRYYITHDGGQSWTQVIGPDPRDAGSSAAAASFTDAQHGAFLNDRGELLSTADGGRTWTRHDFGPTTANGTALQSVSATEAWMISNGSLAHTTDAGATWTVPLLPARLQSGVTGEQWLDAAHGWIWGFPSTGGSCYLSATADGGATWTDATVPAAGCVGSAVFSASGAGVVELNYGQGAYVTTDSGKSWTISAQAASLGLTGRLQAGFSAGDVWFLSGAQLVHSTDGGQTWVIAQSVTDAINAVHFVDANHGWAVGNNGAIYASADGGSTWTRQASGTTQALLAVGGVDANTAWVITSSGQVLSTATGGF